MTDIVLLPITNSANVSVVNDNNAKIQQSINEDILHLAGGNNTMLQQLDMNSNKIINIKTDPNDPDSMVTVGAGDSRWYNVAGDTLTGSMNAGGQRLINLPVPVGATEPVRKGEYDSQVSNLVSTDNVNKLQSIRGQDGEQLTPLLPAASRANKVMGFDASGNPLAILPASGSGTEVAIDLANDADPNKGLGMVGRKRWNDLWSSVGAGKITGQSILDSMPVNLWEFAYLVTVKPDASNPSTWDWTPAAQAAIDTSASLKKRMFIPPGDYNITASLVAPADLITNIYSDSLYYTGAAIGAVAASPVRFICDIPSGPLFTSPGRVRVRLNIQGIAAVNVSTVNPDCRFIDCEVFGSTITENFAHSFHGFAKGNVGFISSIRRNVSMNTRLTALEGSYVDSYVDENYLSMSVDTVDVETAIFRGSMGLTSFTKNFSEFSVRGIVSTSLTNQTIRGNTWDYIAKPLDISGVSGGSIGDNKFTHCSKVFAGRLNLSPSNPLRTSNWVSMNFGSTIRGLSVFGNVGSRVDILGSFKSNNYFNIVTTGNVVEPVTDVASSNILWDVATASIDNLTLTENNDRIYATSPNMSGVSEGQRFGVGNLRYLKLGGQAKLTTCSASKVLATVTASELLDMSALPLRVPLRLHVVVGSGFSTYSYKIYDIYRDSGLQVFTISANEANAPVASSTVTVSGNNISINAVGSSASKTMAYNFLIL